MPARPILESPTSDSCKQTDASRRGRPRATLACVTCRLRKVKCDFQTAEDHICTACRSSNTKCVLNRRDGRRRRESLEDIMSMKSRLELLESLIDYHADADGRALTSSVSQAQTSENETAYSETSGQAPGALSSRKREQQQFPPDIEPQLVPNNITSASCNQAGTGNQLDHMFDASVLDSAYGLTNAHGEPLPLRNPLGLPNMPHPNTPFANISNVRIRPRFHAESDLAQLSFYGPTSQCYLQYQCSGPELDDQDSDSSPPLLRVDADAPSVRKAILESFWRSSELWSSIVDRDFFVASKAAGHSSQYYSQGLEDSMLACGSRNSTSSAIRMVGREYLNRAKRSLQTEIESPTIASLQGCLLVSNYEAGVGQNRIGWMFMGMAIRLLFDLGLHEDRSTLVERGAISVEEWRYQKRLFLCTFLYDTVWGWFIGRPRSIPLPSIALALSTNAMDEGDQSHLHEWTCLCTQVARAQDIINGTMPLDSDAMDRLSRIYVALESDYSNLPSNLAWNEDDTVTLEPSAYPLHTQYLAVQIMLLRPPSRNTQSTQYQDIIETNDNVLPGFTLQTALDLIHQKAVRIARLVQLLTQIHGIELVVPTILDNIFIATRSLIREVLRNPQTLDSDEQWLRMFAQILGTVQRHYHMACRIRNALLDMVRGTTMAGIFDTGLSNPDMMWLPAQGRSPMGGGTYTWPASGPDLLMNDFQKALGLSTGPLDNGQGSVIQPDLAWLFGKA